MSNGLPSPAAARRIDQICDAFESAWQNGERPQIETYLEGTSGSERAALLRQLLLLEWDLAGEPNAKAYLLRFPDDRKVVAESVDSFVRHVQDPAGGTSDTRPHDSTRSPKGGAPADRAAGSSVFARYELLDVMGRGGIGVVYRARDRRLGREVAVKVLAPDKQSDRELVERIRYEAQVCSQLQHPGIVPLYDYDICSDGKVFITMKLVAGATLAEMLQPAGENDQPPQSDLPQLLIVFEQVCQAVAYAHARGVVHRDLKPANVMVGSFGEVQVMDWGFAKVLDTAGSAEGRCLSARLEDTASRQGGVFGTPGYMAPEQASGKNDVIDCRTDVFGLGAILCQILTGEPPFVGESSARLSKTAAGDVAEALKRLEQCSAAPELVALTRRCLSPDPGLRPADASAVAGALRAFHASTEQRLQTARVEKATAESRAATERKSRRFTLVMACIVIASLIVGGRSWLNQRQTSARVEQRVLMTLDVSRTAQEEGRWSEAWSQAHRARDLLQHAAVDPHLATAARENLRQLEPVRELEQIRELQCLLMGQSGRDESTAVDRYRDVFAGLGINARETSSAESAATLDRLASPIRRRMLDGLGDWLWIIERNQGDGAWHRSVIHAAGRDSWRVLVSDAMESRDPREISQFVESTNVETMSVSAAIQLSRTLAILDKTDQARRLLQQAHQIYPDDFWLNFELAIHCQNATQFDDALRYMQAAQVLRPDSPGIYASLALIYGLLERPLDAERVCRHGLRIDPKFAVLHNNLGSALEAQGRLKEAVDCYRTAIQLKPEFAAAYSNLSLALYRNGQPEAALESARRSVAIDPDLAVGQNTLGVAMEVLGESAQAQSAFEKAIDLSPRFANAHNNLGFLKFRKGRLQEAESHFREAIRLRAAYTSAHMHLGITLARLNRPSEACDSWLAALRAGPTTLEQYNTLGISLARNGLGNEAIPPLMKTIQLKPQADLAIQTLARVYKERGDLHQAIALVQKKRDEYPDRAPIHRILGALYFEAGRFRESAACMEAGLALSRRDAARRRLEAHLALAQRFVDLQQQLTDDPQPPLRGKQALDAARFYEYTGDYARSLSYYRIAIEDIPMNDQSVPFLVSAARVAVIASRTDKAPDLLRAEALDWLNRAIQYQRRQITDERKRSQVWRTLTFWQRTWGFDAVREPQQLTPLALAEQRDWARLWGDLEVLRQQAAGRD